MKIMFEDDSSAKCEIVEALNEAGNSEKKYHIRGTFSTIGEKNRNGRIYPKELWEKEIDSYQKNIEEGTIYTLMEYEHPARTNVDPMEAVAKIIELKIVDNGTKVYGDAVLLDNAKANQLKSLIDNGVKISVSSRGVGSVKNGVVDNFKLITYDIVPNPSDFHATMNGVCESCMLTEGVIEDLEFEIDDNDEIKPIKSKKDLNNYKKALISKVESFFKNL